jgi:hypothetical protein
MYKKFYIARPDTVCVLYAYAYLLYRLKQVLARSNKLTRGTTELVLSFKGGEFTSAQERCLT